VVHFFYKRSCVDGFEETVPLSQCSASNPSKRIRLALRIPRDLLSWKCQPENCRFMKRRASNHRELVHVQDACDAYSLSAGLSCRNPLQHPVQTYALRGFPRLGLGFVRETCGVHTDPRSMQAAQIPHCRNSPSTDTWRLCCPTRTCIKQCECPLCSIFSNRLTFGVPNSRKAITDTVTKGGKKGRHTIRKKADDSIIRVTCPTDTRAGPNAPCRFPH